jgi:hypothetical protein
VAASLLLALGLRGPPADAAATAAPPVEIRLRPQQLDYFVPPPSSPELLLRLRARDAPAKARIMFTRPRPAGRHRYRIEILDGRAEHTVVIATPMQPGRSSVSVEVAGQGRIDLGFWSEGGAGKEYRFTLIAPAKPTTFDLNLQD